MQSDELISLFSRHPDIIEVDGGETIFEEDTPGDAMYVVLDGEVDLSISRQIFETAAAGQIFGEMALIDVPVRSATATARRDCRLAVVNEEGFIVLVREHPQFALHLMAVLAERLRKIDRIALAGK